MFTGRAVLSISQTTSLMMTRTDHGGISCDACTRNDCKNCAGKDCWCFNDGCDRAEILNRLLYPEDESGATDVACIKPRRWLDLGD